MHIAAETSATGRADPLRRWGRGQRMEVMTIGTLETRPASTARAVITAASAGDAKATESFVRWAWPRAHRVAFLLTHDAGAAEDIAQEAVLSAVRTMPSFDLSRDPGPWLERIAANRAIDFIRRKQRRPEAELIEEQLPDESLLVRELTTTIESAISADVMEAFGGLSPVQRQTVVLRHLLDYEPAEIAEMLDLPGSTVRTHIHRGLQRLRERLQNNERRSA